MTDENLDRDDLEPDEEDEPLFVSDFLRDAINEQKNRPTASDKIDFSQFRNDVSEDWESFTESDSFPYKLRELVQKSILLPRSFFQVPIACSYLMLPSALCSRTPILFSQGASGCGKSTLGYLASKLHGVQLISAGSTFASIRNTISTARKWDSSAPLEQPGNEKNTALIWEDIKPEDLSGDNGNIFALLKNGVERTGTITIAELGGTNKTFKIFSPKLISSIHPIYAKHEFRELVRRLVIIQHKPVQHWTADDYDEGSPVPDANDLIDPTDLNWEGFSRAYREFWEDKGTLERWVSISRSLAHIKNHGMNANNYKMSRDLITCGLVCGYWLSKEDALEHMKRYWEWHRDSIESQTSATQKALKAFIDEKTANTIEQNAKLAGTSLEYLIKPLEIDPKELKTHIEHLASQGELDTGVRVGEIVPSMANLGWELKPNAAKRNTWQLINS